MWGVAAARVRSVWATHVGVSLPVIRAVHFARLEEVQHWWCAARVEGKQGRQKRRDDAVMDAPGGGTRAGLSTVHADRVVRAASGPPEKMVYQAKKTQRAVSSRKGTTKTDSESRYNIVVCGELAGRKRGKDTRTVAKR